MWGEGKSVRLSTDSGESDLEKKKASAGERKRTKLKAARERRCWDESLVPVFSDKHCFAPETDGGLVYKNASLCQKTKISHCSGFYYNRVAPRCTRHAAQPR